LLTFVVSNFGCFHNPIFHGINNFAAFINVADGAQTRLSLFQCRVRFLEQLLLAIQGNSQLVYVGVRSVNLHP
jgi:hypothetical protein